MKIQKNTPLIQPEKANISHLYRMDNTGISKASIEAAYNRIENAIHKTSIITSKLIDSRLGAQVFFKTENTQKSGSFKMRGALNALSKAEIPASGVTTHSSGNHGQALAKAALSNGIKARIVMPETAPLVKIEAVKEYGGEVILCPPTLTDREGFMNQIIEEFGSLPIPPFDHEDIIEGQATCAMELFNQVESLDYLFCPIGGGGLAAGTVLARNFFSPNTEIIAAEPEGADDAYKSFKLGITDFEHNPNTIADGLLTKVGRINFPILKAGLNDVVTISDQEITEAMKLLYRFTKTVVEPSGAVSFAGLIKQKNRLKGKRIGVILSGGNIDLSRLQTLFA